MKIKDIAESLKVPLLTPWDPDIPPHAVASWRRKLMLWVHPDKIAKDGCSALGAYVQRMVEYGDNEEPGKVMNNAKDLYDAAV